MGCILYKNKKEKEHALLREWAQFEVENFMRKLRIWIIVLLWRLPLEVLRWLEELYNIEQLKRKRK